MNTSSAKEYRPLRRVLSVVIAAAIVVTAMACNPTDGTTASPTTPAPVARTDTTWLGTKRIAFVPVYRNNAVPPDVIPSGWKDDIRRRAMNYPRPEANGADRSLRAWVRAASSNRADIDATVLDMLTVDRQLVDDRPDWDKPFESLGASLRGEGYHAAVLVMLGGVGAAANLGFWSRVVMVETNGTWLMEILHALTGLADFYAFGNDTDPEANNIGRFEEMSGQTSTHPTAYVKNALGWLDAASVRNFVGPSSELELESVGRPQPPAPGRASAIRVGDAVPYLMIEARTKNDTFEAGNPDGGEWGIPSEGVIAYRVQTQDPTVNLRPTGKIPLYLLTLTALRPGQSAVLDGDVTLTVTGETSTGFTIKLTNPNVHLIDRTKATDAATATGPVSAVVLAPYGIDDVTYRNAEGHLWEIWRDRVGLGRTDLTANAGAPVAASNPYPYFDDSSRQVVLVYRGTDNEVHTLWWLWGAVGHDSLSRSINAPHAVGNPVGWYAPNDGVNHVAYRGPDGHLHVLSWQGQGLAQHTDVTAPPGMVPAAGDPSPYYDPVRGTNFLVFRDIDGNVRSNYWGGANPTGQDDLSGYAHTPKAASDPFAWYTRPDDTSHVIYRATNNHIYELAWPNVIPVSGRDLTQAAGAPVADGNVTGGYNPAENTQHVIYRSTDGSLHELWYFVGDTAVHHVDLTTAYGAPKAADRPVYFATADRQHVAYRGTDGHIYELLW